MKQKQTHREQTYSCQEGGVGGRRGMEWEFGVSKLLYIEWMDRSYWIAGNYILW